MEKAKKVIEQEKEIKKKQNQLKELTYILNIGG